MKRSLTSLQRKIIKPSVPKRIRGRLQEVVVYEWFDWEIFGVLDRWSQRGKLTCYKVAKILSVIDNSTDWVYFSSAFHRLSLTAVVFALCGDPLAQRMN